MTTATQAPEYTFEFADYQDPTFRSEFLADMERISPLQRRHPSGRAVLTYDPARYDFRSLVGDALAAAGMLDRQALRARGDRLELLHELIAPEHQVMDGSQQSAAARVLYEMPPPFGALYERFVDEVVAPGLDQGPLHYQLVPTFRVFFPNAPGYPGPTSYHNDLMIGHNPREVNVFVPLVACEATRSLLFAELPESLAVLRAYGHDFAAIGRGVREDAALQTRLGAICAPLRTAVGEVVVFDSRCLHAGPWNRTAATRVTFDLRVLPTSELATQRNRYRGLGRRRAAFVVGEYFSTHAVGIGRGD